jgi:glyoxylase-like metal-dependent hydrolase (beta-lactamase superfamily II)
MTELVPLCLGWMSNEASLMVPGETGTMRYPIPGYAVVHERGTVLFDTGLHEPLMTSSEELGALAAMFAPELTPQDLAEARLAEAGIDPESVTHVVNSHLHFDHCGRNGPFGNAVTLIQTPEWEAAQHPTRYAYVGVPLDEIGAGDLRLVDGELDLFGDGTVVLVPTPGHTVGHQSLLVRASPAPGADSALLVGDACYVRRMLTARVTPGFAADVDGQLASYDVLARHEAAGTRLIFSHDVDEWDAVPPGLRSSADG